jgi:uroporphyrin-III C-methyltransferase
MRLGFVHLVGAGPGDPGLLTLRAAELIGRAQVIVHDRLIHPDVLRLTRGPTRIVDVGKEGGGAHTEQESINRLLIRHARQGREVVRLKGGDPFVFGRGGEEALALAAAGIPFDVVPGVSSGVAVPGLVGIPVTHRYLAASVTFATARCAGQQPRWTELASADTLVLFMGGRRLVVASTALIAAGKPRSTPAAVVEAGSYEHERVVEGTLATIATLAERARIGSPALLVVGPVVALRRQLKSSEAHGLRRGA